MNLQRMLRSVATRLRPAEPSPLILLYHRIAAAAVDPWDLAVSPDHFAEQLEVLRRTRHPMTLAAFVRHLEAGTLPRDAVAVTFDDGYADNLLAAKPRLAAADVPATIFLATDCLERRNGCWWDELAALVLCQDGPRVLQLEIGGTAMEFDLGSESALADAGPWRASSGPVTARQAAYLAIWQALRPLDEGRREGVMQALRSRFAARDEDGGADRMMTREEARLIAADGLVTIGAHSVTHPALTGLDPAARRREIADSKTACEALTGAPVTAFAYPYGDLDDTVRAAVGQAGFTCACSTRSAPVAVPSDVLALPRIQVLDWDGEAFDRALREGFLGAPAWSARQ